MRVPTIACCAHSRCALRRATPKGTRLLWRQPRVRLTAAFALSGTNSKDCPPSYSRLDTEAACKGVAAIAGTAYTGSAMYSYYPAGCFRHTISGSVYLNTHADGANSSFAQPLCVGAPNARTAAGMHRRCGRAACDGEREIGAGRATIAGLTHARTHARTGTEGGCAHMW